MGASPDSSSGQGTANGDSAKGPRPLQAITTRDPVAVIPGPGEAG